MMDWLYYTPDAAAAASPGSLGYYVGDKFRMSSDAADTLENMNVRLAGEDRMLRTYRR